MDERPGDYRSDVPWVELQWPAGNISPGAIFVPKSFGRFDYTASSFPGVFFRGTFGRAATQIDSFPSAYGKRRKRNGKKTTRNFSGSVRKGRATLLNFDVVFSLSGFRNLF